MKIDSYWTLLDGLYTRSNLQTDDEYYVVPDLNVVL
jgi:hypothetical protein